MRLFRVILLGGIGTIAWITWPSAGEAVDPIRFEDIADRAGVPFIVRNSAAGLKHQIETMISGVAVFDYNNDANPDIYFVNGARIPELIKPGPKFHNRLYPNNGAGAFTDVTAQAGGERYGMGVATGDYHKDGYVDLFLPGVTQSILYRNEGNGTFRSVTRAAGLEGIDSKRGKLWSIAAGWFDYDNDRRLDLFVVNYCVWSLEREKVCGDVKAGFRTYCDPRLYEGLPNNLYHNNKDGTFTDVSQASGIAAHIGKGMGVAFADYDQDGDLDVCVANDTEPNFLFRNEGKGKFVEVGLRAGVGYNDDGRAVSSMGVDFRDYDNDGREGVFVFCVNQRDVSAVSELVSGSLRRGFDSILFENIGDGSSRHPMAEIAEGSLDARVAPGSILSHHLNNQRPNLSHHAGSAGATTCGLMVFVGNKLPMPREQGFGSNERRDILQHTSTRDLAFSASRRR